MNSEAAPERGGDLCQQRRFGLFLGEWLLIVLFAGIIMLPTLDEIFHLDVSPVPGENRLLASVPKVPSLAAPGLRRWSAAWENYYNDHFGYRKWLIRRFQQWKFRLFRDQSGYKVIVGKNHWLYTPEEQSIDHFLGRFRFTPRQLQTWATLLDKRTDWLAARGIQYVFVVPPDKQDIYPENLPDWMLQAAPAHRESKLDQLLAYLPGHSHTTLLDLRSGLLAAKTNQPVYLQNDTHWNLCGAFLGCQALLQTLVLRQPALSPLAAADFPLTNTPVPGGDMARILGQNTMEPNHYDLLAHPPLADLQITEIPRFPTAWGIKSVFIAEAQSIKGPNLVLFHDSFAEPWKDFLSYRFHRVVFEHYSPDFHRELIQTNHPAVVVTEMLERAFNEQDPEVILQTDGLP